MENRDGRIRTRAAIVLLSMLVLAVMLVRTRRPGPQPGAESPAPVIVEIRGDLRGRGVYTLDPGDATVSGALAKGGLPGGLPSGLGSRRLVSGDSLEVLGAGQDLRVRIGRMPPAALLASGQKIDINSASVEDLQLVPHMRAEVAQSIVRRRLEKPWQNVEEIRELQGVGPKTAQKLARYLEVPGKQQESEGESLN